jgi:hypothetical protein
LIGIAELEFWIVSVGARKTDEVTSVQLAVFFQTALAAGGVFVVLRVIVCH